MSFDPHIREALRLILAEMTPHEGVTALLRRHHFGGTFFPVAVAHGKSVVSSLEHSDIQYSMFATDVESSPASTQLCAKSNICDLTRHAKLAACSLDPGQFLVQTFPCGDSGESYVQVISPLSIPVIEGRQHPLTQIAARLLDCWSIHHTTLRPMDASGSTDILDNVAHALSDASAVPPYYPLLHARIKTSSGNRFVSNTLSYGCELLAKCTELRAQYIDAMFRRALVERIFSDPIPKHANPLAAAYAKLSTDIVVRLARSADGTAMLCARYNIIRDSVSAANSWIQNRHAQERVLTPWHMLKYALTAPGKDCPGAALVTTWVAQMTGGLVADALPVGIIAGSEHVKLSALMEDESLQGFREDFPARPSVVQVSVLAGLGMKMTRWPLIAGRLLEIVTRMDEAHSYKPAPLKGPFELDFQSDPWIKELLIRPTDARSESFAVAPDANTKVKPSVYQFLFALASDKDGRLTRQTASDDFGIAEGQLVDKMEERVNRKLKGLVSNTRRSIDSLKDIFVLDKFGWRLTARVKPRSMVGSDNHRAHGGTGRENSSS